MSRTALVTLALAGCLLLAACGSGGEEEVSGGLTGAGTDVADLTRPAAPAVTSPDRAPAATEVEPSTPVTVTAPAETVTTTVAGPTETVTAPAQTVTEQAQTVTVTSAEDSGGAAPAAAGAAAGAAAAQSKSSESDALPDWAWGLIGAALGAGVLGLVVYIRHLRARSREGPDTG